MNKQLLIQHQLNAPRDLVFRAWTDPAQLQKWYAPDGCSITFQFIKPIEGGDFHFCINDPIHGECWIVGEYLEVVRPSKLVFTMVLADEEGNAVTALDAGKAESWPEAIVTTVLFEGIGEQTTITLHQTVQEEQAKESGAYQSWLNMLEKLNKLLASR